MLVVVDRTELEGQLKDWVERLLGDMQNQDIPVWRANSRTDLQSLLKTDRRGLILSMIHKFEGMEADANTRDTSTCSSTRRTARLPRTWAPT